MADRLAQAKGRGEDIIQSGLQIGGLTGEDIRCFDSIHSILLYNLN
jgi:hypothetical protein